MRHLLRLYPRWWRERYGEEFAELIADLSGARRRLGLAIDICRGALDARLRGRHGMRRWSVDAAVRRGAYDGMIVAGALAVLVVLTNVVFPGGPEESDGDPGYLVQFLATYALLGLLLITIGARAQRRATTPLAGAKGGGAAGFVIAVLVTLTFLAVNNLFFDIVSQQHDKRVAFAASGWSSMRAYLSVTQLAGALVLVPMLTLVGAVLGIVGGTVLGRRAPTSTA